MVLCVFKGQFHQETEKEIKKLFLWRLASFLYCKLVVLDY